MLILVAGFPACRSTSGPDVLPPPADNGGSRDTANDAASQMGSSADGAPSSPGPGIDASPRVDSPAASLDMSARADVANDRPPGGGTSDAACDARVEREPLDVFLLVDASGSLQTPVDDTTKWELLHQTITSFLGDARGAGMAVGLQFMPLAASQTTCQSDRDCGFQTPPFVPACRDPSACQASDGSLRPFACMVGLPCPNMLGSCVPLGRCARTGVACTGSTAGAPCTGGDDRCEAAARSCLTIAPEKLCDAGSYATPAMGFTALPAPGAALAKTTFLTRRPSGPTAMAGALEGVFGYLGQQVATRPGRRAVLVLLSDGVPPSGCGAGEMAGIVGQLEAARLAGPPVKTFVLGFPGLGSSPTLFLETLARAGGTDPLIYTAGGNLGLKLAEAIDKERGRSSAVCPKP